MNNTTIKLIIDSKPLSNGMHKVYLRVIKNRKRKNISLGLDCKKDNFLNESFTRNHTNHKQDNELLVTFKNRALKIIRDFDLNEKDFSLEEFESEFRFSKKNSNVELSSFFEEIICEMVRAGKIGNAVAYKETNASIIKFGGKRLKFSDITPTFLDKYEVFLRETGSQNGGIAFKMRELRALFNKARKRKIIPKELYPFEEYKISKLKSTTIKRALTLNEFIKIRDVDLSSYPPLMEAYNFFMFSIYTRGMNFKDMMHLRWSDIYNGRIHYTRSKTQGVFNLEIIENVQTILDYYKAQGRSTNYVFPILLSDDMTPGQISDRKHKVLQRYNSKLKEIAKLAGVEMKLTSYVARHSFANILKISGTPIEKISEMMGHADVSVTMNYLKEFSNEDLDVENRKFMKF